MKKSINAWCYPGSFSIKQCMNYSKEAGFHGLELNMTEDKHNKSIVTSLNFQENPGLNTESKEEDILKIYEDSKEIGINIASISSSLHWTYSLTSEDESIRRKAMDIVKKMIDAAVLLETDAILVVPGVVNENVSYMEAYKRSLKAFKKLRTYAEANKVHIGIENVWNKFLLSPLEMKAFIEEIGSSYVGAYFDVGNVLAYSYPEYWIEILERYIVRVHVKDFDTSIGNITGFKNLLQGDVNWVKVMEALRRIKYKGYVTAELTPYKTCPEIIAHDTSSHMDRILAL